MSQPDASSAADVLTPEPSFWPPGSPFRLDQVEAYRRWREQKLRIYPASTDELVVEIQDPMRLREAERAALGARCARANMAVYASRRIDEDRQIPLAIGRQVGLARLDANWLADADAISSIRVQADRPRREHIPYTDRPISWHTDGYYNSEQRRVRSMVLHCVRAAATGGENALLDHEIAYLILRDQDPEFIRALSAPDAMTIPAREDEQGVARQAQTGPVFRVDPVTGRLHMRYTARTRSILWRDDDVTRAAVACLESLLAGQLRGARELILTARLAPGMGLLCANVLHTRSGFVDNPGRPRLLYRARYYDELDFFQALRGDNTCNLTKNWTLADSLVRCPS